MPKKSLLKSMAPFVLPRQVGQVQRADPEHVAGALGIRSGDDRRVDPEIAVFMEVTVNGLGGRMPNPGDGAKGVGARPQVRDFAQKLKAVLLGLDRVGVGICHPTNHVYRVGLDFVLLPTAGRFHQGALALHGATRGQLQNFAAVVVQLAGRHDLDGIEAGAVVDVDKGKAGLGIAPGADPALRWLRVEPMPGLPARASLILMDDMMDELILDQETPNNKAPATEPKPR